MSGGSVDRLCWSFTLPLCGFAVIVKAIASVDIRYPSGRVVKHGWELEKSARRLIPSRLMIRDYVQRHRWASTKASTHPSKWKTPSTPIATSRSQTSRPGLRATYPFPRRRSELVERHVPSAWGSASRLHRSTITIPLSETHPALGAKGSSLKPLWGCCRSPRPT